MCLADLLTLFVHLVSCTPTSWPLSDGSTLAVTSLVPTTSTTFGGATTKSYPPGLRLWTSSIICIGEDSPGMQASLPSLGDYLLLKSGRRRDILNHLLQGSRFLTCMQTWGSKVIHCSKHKKTSKWKNISKYEQHFRRSYTFVFFEVWVDFRTNFLFFDWNSELDWSKSPWSRLELEFYDSLS